MDCENINTAFLYLCQSLTSVNLSGFNTVKGIGHFFMGGCTSLNTLDFKYLANVTYIGNYFLYLCRLQTVNLTPLSKITWISSGFLYYSTGLTTLYTPLKDPKTFTVVSDYFMKNVSSNCVIHAGKYAEQYKTTSP